MTTHRETLVALSRLKNGETELSADQYVELLEAVEQAVKALQAAPSGADPVATGIWHNHDRAPALARLADAVAPQEHGAASEALTQEQLSDREVLHQLHQALLNSRPPSGQGHAPGM